LPSTIIHGELYASNVVIQQAGGGVRVRPVDWEMAGTGPGVLDLAALTAGSWTDDERARIEEAYCEALPVELRPGADDLEYARLLLAAQWLGWSDGWLPPQEHRQDWAAVAVSLIERLGL
jgi:thiamine kinase-like enzyme